METLGREMLEFCHGLPLAIEVLAGLLLRMPTVDQWELVKRNIEAYIRNGENRVEPTPWNYEGVLWVLSLSYDDLPHEKRQCLLHLARCADRDNVSMNELHRMWMAEGLVESEDQASEFVNEFVNRYLVQVTRRSSISGSVKKYQMHALIRDLCFTKAPEENFLQIYDYRNRQEGWRAQRLAVNVDNRTEKAIRETIRLTPDSIRSFMCFTTSENPYLEPVMKPLFNRFRRLRVLKFENQSCGEIGKLPDEIQKLIHLRFLSLKNSHVTKLPRSMANLRRLQTLDLRTNVQWELKLSGSNPFAHEDFRLTPLRHLYLLQGIVVENGNLFPLDNLFELRTLVNLPIEFCETARLAQLSNLEKLKLRGSPLRLGGARRICFDNTMGALRGLPRLKILKFKSSVFVRGDIRCGPEGFQELRSLYFNNVTNFNALVVDEGSLPNLRRLSVKNCRRFRRSDHLRQQIRHRNIEFVY